MSSDRTSSDASKPNAWRNLWHFVSDQWELKLLILLAVGGIVIEYVPWVKLEGINLQSFMLALLCAFALHEIKEGAAIHDRVSQIHHNIDAAQPLHEAVGSALGDVDVSIQEVRQELKQQHAQLVDLAGYQAALSRLLEASSRVRTLDQAEFYAELATAATRATRRIELTHHEALPPSLTGIAEKRRYFEAIERKILRTDVHVSRIVAIPNLEKLAWVEDYLLEKFKNQGNFHLRYTPFSLASDTPLVPLSLQIVDRQRCFLINLAAGTHTETEDDIDLLIEGPLVSEYFARYYANYWQRCQPLKEGRKIYHENLAELRRRLSEAYQ